MDINSMLTEFVESYPRDAIKYIDNMKNDYGRTINGYTVKLVDTCESFNNFCSWANGFAAYCIEEAKNNSEVSIDIMERTFTKAVESGQVICEKEYKYPEIPSYITGYLDGLKKMDESVQSAKSLMMENGIEPDIVGGIESFVDRFVESMHESFITGMDTLLVASGYKAHQTLHNRSGFPVKKEKVVIV